MINKHFTSSPLLNNSYDDNKVKLYKHGKEKYHIEDPRS